MALAKQWPWPLLKKVCVVCSTNPNISYSTNKDISNQTDLIYSYQWLILLYVIYYLHVDVLYHPHYRWDNPHGMQKQGQG